MAAQGSGGGGGGEAGGGGGPPSSALLSLGPRPAGGVRSRYVDIFAAPPTSTPASAPALAPGLLPPGGLTHAAHPSPDLAAQPVSLACRVAALPPAELRPADPERGTGSTGRRGVTSLMRDCGAVRDQQQQQLRPMAAAAGRRGSHWAAVSAATPGLQPQWPQAPLPPAYLAATPPPLAPPSPLPPPPLTSPTAMAPQAWLTCSQQPAPPPHPWLQGQAAVARGQGPPGGGEAGWGAGAAAAGASGAYDGVGALAGAQAGFGSAPPQQTAPWAQGGGEMEEVAL
ncbi:hypothetical protein V8C86DRAFT_3033502 [Haematococcus lacustris]